MRHLLVALLRSLVVVAVAVIGILGIQSATYQGKVIAGGELDTAVATNQLAREMDAAYAAGQGALRAADPATRSRLLGTLYTSLLPGIDAQLFSLQQLHIGDPPAERADLALFIRQWNAVRDLLSAPGLAAQPPAASAALAGALTAAYQPVSAHLDRLTLKELSDARADHAAAAAAADRSISLILGTAAVGVGIVWLWLWHDIRRSRRSLQSGQDQTEFADILQLANGEDEAQQLLQRHLERTLPATAAVMLNRNNSADRLEAVTPLPPGSPLARTLRGAQPRSCLAVRSGQMHTENGGRPPLLSCPVCSPVPGASSCVPLMVGGAVIGSVLLTRPAPYSEAEEQRIRESVSQAAPVLANLRNLAVAEIRAATDGLTGLPNKRAATDALKRTFAQATMTNSPLGLLMLDLDHFKQVNDQYGHAAGDQVLASVGAVLRSVLRDRDFAGRNGGEEFAVLLPDTDIAAALEIAERVRATIAEITLPGTDVPVTVSIGVAGYPDHAEHPGPARAPRRRGPVRGQAAGPEPRRAGRAGLRRRPGRSIRARSTRARSIRARSTRAVGQRCRAGAGAQGRPGVTTPGSAWPTGRGRSAARAWSAGSRPRPSRPCRAAPRWSARPS